MFKQEIEAMKKAIGGRVLQLTVVLLLWGVNLAVQSEEQVLWAGCGITKKAFMNELAEAYQAKTGHVIKMEGGGAARGIRDAVSGQSHFGGTCRIPLPETDSSELYAETYPIAWDALAVITHSSNEINNFSAEQIRAIYTGELTDWTQLGGKPGPIHLYVRKGSDSGVGYSIRQYIFDDDAVTFKTSPNYIMASSGPIEKAVESDPLAIAITGVSSARKRSLSIASYEDLQPSYENIKTGRYPLFRPLYLVVGSNSKSNSSAKAFIDFAKSEAGREILRRNGTVPYFDALHLMARTSTYGLNLR